MSLQETTNQGHQKNLVVVMVDFKAKIGRDNTGRERVMGRNEEGGGNDKKWREAVCGSMNEMVIGGTLFKHKHKMTWTSLDGKTENHIDHMVASNKGSGKKGPEKKALRK